MEAQPFNTDNVIFLDELPRFIERRDTKLALGQLTLFANDDECQLLLFPEREEWPDDAA